MGLFDLFKKKAVEPAPAPQPGPGEKMVVFTDLGMH